MGPSSELIGNEEKENINKIFDDGGGILFEALMIISETIPLWLNLPPKTQNIFMSIIR